MALVFKKLTEHIGVEVSGLDVSQDVAPETANKLRAALEKNFVLFIRDQHITPQQEVDYARIFGTPESLSGYGGSALDSTTSSLPAEIMQITNDPNNPASKRQKGTARWHTDLTWSKLPSKGAVLHAQKLPSDGAGTRWCALYAAWNDLPAKRKAELEKLRVVHSVGAAMLRDHPDAMDRDLDAWRRVPGVEHPLVWTHSDGNKSLVLGATVDRVIGMAKVESDELVAELEEWCTQDKYVYQHEWRANDLLMWFNSATMHQAVEYIGPERRLLYRVTITGEEEIQ